MSNIDRFNKNKNIFICYKNLSALVKVAELWKRLNPDWKIWIFDNNNCREFLYKNYGLTAVKIFDSLKDGPIKADFWRACIIYRLGGLYVDADINPQVPLSSFIFPDDYFISCVSNLFDGENINNYMSPGYSFNPHFIYSYPGNGILRKSINFYFQKFYKNDKYDYWGWSIVDCWKKIYEVQVLGYFMKKLNTKSLKLKGKKYKFLTERFIDRGLRDSYNLHNFACVFNNHIILWNRLDEYNSRDHTFNENFNNFSNNSVSHYNNNYNNNNNLKKNYNSNRNIIIIDNRTFKQNPGFRNNKIKMNIKDVQKKRLLLN